MCDAGQTGPGPSDIMHCSIVLLLFLFLSCQAEQISAKVKAEAKLCEERHELLAAISLAVDSVKKLNSAQVLEFISVLNEDMEVALNKQRASLMTAQRIRSKFIEINPGISSSDQVADRCPEERRMKVNDEAEGDMPVSKGAAKAAVSAASKPPPPLLEESRSNAVILGLAEPAEAYQVFRRALSTKAVSNSECQVAWEKSCQHSRGTAWLQPITTNESSYEVTDLASGSDYRFRYRALVDGVWSEWSKAVIYNTTLFANESMNLSDLYDDGPFSFRPIGSFFCTYLSEECMRGSGSSKTWTEILGRLLGTLNSLNSSLASQLEKSLADYDLRGKDPVKEQEKECEQEDDILMMESDTEARAPSPGRSVGSESHTSTQSASGPVPRARTKADLRLGGLRLVSTPKDLNMHRPNSPSRREAKRARSALDSSRPYSEDMVQGDGEWQRQRASESEVEVRERKLLSLKLAARLQRLQAPALQPSGDVDLDPSGAALDSGAARWPPSPPAPGAANSQAAGSGGDAKRHSSTESEQRTCFIDLSQKLTTVNFARLAGRPNHKSLVVGTSPKCHPLEHSMISHEPDNIIPHGPDTSVPKSDSCATGGEQLTKSARLDQGKNCGADACRQQSLESEAILGLEERRQVMAEESSER